MIRTIQILFLSTVIFFLGCATVPPESVVLNREVGKKIQDMYESNTRLVNLYFTTKKVEVDQAAERAIDTFYRSIIKEVSLGNAPPLTEAALRGIQTRVQSYYLRADSVKKDLEKSRILVLEKFNTHYMETIRANEAITGLLQSHVDMDKATDDSIQSLKTMTGGAVDLTKVRDIVDRAITTSGDISKKGIEIYPQIEKLLNKYTKK